MTARIRFNYLRLVLPLLAVLLAASAALLRITGLGIKYAFREPVELSSLAGYAQSTDELEGIYASVGVDELGDTFSYYGYTDENEEKVVVERYCVYVLGDRFLTVRVTGDELALLKEYDDAKELVASGKLGSMKEFKAGALTGTITASLDDRVYELLCSWIKENYLTGNNRNDESKRALLSHYNLPAASDAEDAASADYSAFYKEAIVPLQLEAGYYGRMPEGKAVALTIVAALLTLVALALAASVFLGLWERPLRGHTKKYGRGALSVDYRSGLDFKKTLRVGDRFIWCFRGLFTDLAEISSVVWAYPRSRRLEGGRQYYYLVLKTEDRRELSVPLGDAAAVQAAIDALRSKGHPLATGYDRDKQKLYEKDLPAFKAKAKSGAI